MNRILNSVRRHRRDAGITLVELLIAVGLGTTVTGIATASMVTALRGTDSVSQQVRESNDAQFVSAYLVRDAQAVGGINPSTGATDTTLGVSETNDGGCAGTGSLVVRFAWNDRSGAVTTPHVAAYFHDAITETLTRHSCVGTGNNSPLQLATEVAVVSAVCTPSCAGIPQQVSLTITSTNEMTNAPTPFSYSLSAAVRPQSRVGPTVLDSASVPLMVLGGTCPALTVSGNTDVSIGGTLVINAGDSGSCSAMTSGGASGFASSGSTLIAGGGTCTGASCPTVSSLVSPYSDPFADLEPPAADCSGSANPARIGSEYQPGTYPLLLSISGTVSFAPGQYYFCNGISFQANAVVTGTEVFFFIESGTVSFSGQSSVSLSAQTTGAYAGILFWQESTTSMNISGGASVNTYSGVIYAPNAEVSLSGGAGSAIKSLIAASVTITGGGSSTFGNAPLTISAPASLASGSVDAAYSSSVVSASGGTPTYTWSATGLPAGLTIDSATGAISGTPSDAGASTVVVTVTDANLLTATANVDITIVGSLAVTGPATLTAGTVAVAYSATEFSASGGTTAYTWSATGLPAGLAIDSATGAISGTPTAAGTSTVVVTVTDASSVTATASASITIAAAVPKPTSLTIANGTGTNRRPTAADTITIVFDQAMAPSSFCSGWNGASKAVVVTITNNVASPAANETLTLATSSGCSFNFGSIDLGLGGYVASNTTFGNSGTSSTAVLTTTGASSTLVVTLGTISATATTVNQNRTATYAPSVLITSTAGVGVSGNVSTTARHF